LNRLFLKDKFNNNFDYSYFIFFLGVFLLPSAFIFGSFLILIASVFSFLKIKNKIFEDIWNKYFLIGGILILLSCIVQFFYYKNLITSNYDVSLTILGLANWLPFLWLFWSTKQYLDNSHKRRLFALSLISGSFPILLTGLGQVFFNWNGPFKTFFDLIIWYQRPMDSVTGLTGLFTNANYAGAWLNIIWPFSLALLIDKKERFFDKFSIYIFIFLISFSILLTNSRSAWLSFFISIFLIIGIKSLKTIRDILFSISIILGLYFVPFLGSGIQNLIGKINPELILLKFTDFKYFRFTIWKESIESILRNPMFGTGAGSFPDIFLSETGFYRNHTHNLPLELMVSYGMPPAIFIFIPIFLLIYFSSKKVLFKNKNIVVPIIDQAWVSALIALIFSQMVDVQYFDGRISIILWLLLVGAKSIIDEKKSLNSA
jgi:O-antigen ligase